jgi:hypothetical protein
MDSGGETIGFPVNVLAGQWTQVVVPLSAIGSPSTVKRINIKDNSGGSQPTFYVDELCLSNSTPPPPPAGCDLPIYLEALAPSWQNWSWDGTYNFADTGQVYAGSFSIGATITQAYGGLSVRHDSRHLRQPLYRPSSSGYMAGQRERRPPAPGDRPGRRSTATSRPSRSTCSPTSGRRWSCRSARSAAHPPSSGSASRTPPAGRSRPSTWTTSVYPRRPHRHPQPGCDVPIYLEALAPNWQNCSWDGSYNFAETAPGLRRQLLDRRDDHQRLWRAVGEEHHSRRR